MPVNLCPCVSVGVFVGVIHGSLCVCVCVCDARVSVCEMHVSMCSLCWDGIVSTEIDFMILYKMVHTQMHLSLSPFEYMLHIVVYINLQKS